MKAVFLRRTALSPLRVLPRRDILYRRGPFSKNAHPWTSKLLNLCFPIRHVLMSANGMPEINGPPTDRIRTTHPQDFHALLHPHAVIDLQTGYKLLLMIYINSTS